MNKRVTKEMLDRQVYSLNKLLDRPLTYFDSPDIKTRKINVGHFHIDTAYGQYSLCETNNARGGVTQHTQLTTKRDLLEKIWVLKVGIAIGEAYQVQLNKKVEL